MQSKIKDIRGELQLLKQEIVDRKGYFTKLADKYINRMDLLDKRLEGIIKDLDEIIESQAKEGKNV